MRMWWTTTTNAALTMGLCSAFMTRVLAEETLHQGERGESRPAAATSQTDSTSLAGVIGFTR